MRVFDYPAGYEGNFHRHRLAQVVYAVRGIVEVSSKEGKWLASPFQAVTIPPWENHRVSAAGNALLHSLFLDPGKYPGVCAELRRINVSELLHELIREAGKHYQDYSSDSITGKVLQLIVELIRKDDTGYDELVLPQPKNPRIAKAISACDFTELRTSQVAKLAAYSERQFSRVFKRDTGMSFRQWRAVYRAQEAMRLLATDKPVTTIAGILGFSSTSAFIEQFKKHTGKTPSALRGRLTNHSTQVS